MAKMWSLWANGWLQGPWRYVARLPAPLTSLSWAHTFVEQPVKKFQSQGLSFSFIIQATKFFQTCSPKRSFTKSPMLQVFVLFRTKTDLRGCGGHGGWRARVRISAERVIKWREWRISRRRLARSGHQCSQSQQVGAQNSAISGLNRLNLVSEFNYSAWMRTQDLLTSFYFQSIESLCHL